MIKQRLPSFELMFGNGVVHSQKLLWQRTKHTSRVQKAKNLLAYNEKYVIILSNRDWQRLENNSWGGVGSVMGLRCHVGCLLFQASAGISLRVNLVCPPLARSVCPGSPRSPGLGKQ